MNDNIILISICLKSTKSNSLFHFIGFYKNYKIKKIYIKDKVFKKNHQYILNLEVLAIIDDYMVAQCKSYKDLEFN